MQRCAMACCCNRKAHKNNSYYAVKYTYYIIRLIKLESDRLPARQGISLLCALVFSS